MTKKTENRETSQAKNQACAAQSRGKREAGSSTKAKLSNWGSCQGQGSLFETGAASPK